MVMVSYDYLQSSKRKGKTSFEILGTSFEEVAALPLVYLDLNEELQNLFVGKKVLVNNEPVVLFNMGSLVGMGKDNVRAYLRGKGYDTTKINELVYQLEFSLAKFSLKLKNTDFTVFDIKVSDLDLSDEAKVWAKRNEFYEVGDLYMLGSTQFNKILLYEKNGERIKKNMLAALKKFGTAPEGNDVRLVAKPKSFTASRSDKKEKGTVNSIEHSFFPKISDTLLIARQEQKKNRKIIALSFFDGADFSGADCDYSNMIKAVKQKYPDLSQFRSEAHISLNTLKKIKNGEEISPKLVALISKTLGISYIDAVRYKKPKLSNNERIIIGNDDYTNMFIRIKSMYGSRKAFCEATKISAGTLNNIYYARHAASAATLKKICAALRCRREDIITSAEGSESQQPKEPAKKKVFYDYSKMKKILLSRHITLTNMCVDLGMKHRRTVLSRQMGFGLKLSDKELKKIAKYLNVKPNDLYSATIGQNPNAECDWTKLKNKLKQHMVALNTVCKALKIPGNYIAMTINSGRYMNSQALNKIAAYLSCEPEDLYTPLKTKDEIAIKRSKVRKLPSYDYSKLLSKCKEKSISLTELSKQLLLSDGFSDRIIKMKGLGYRDIDKLCLFFDCKSQDLFERTNVEDKKTKRVNGIRRTDLSNDCDYTPLLQRVLLTYKNLFTFITKDAGLCATIASKIYSGDILSYNSYKKISDVLNIPIEKLVIFHNPEQREKIMRQIKAHNVDEHTAEYDYSNLFRLMKEKDITQKDLTNSVISLTTYRKIMFGKKIGAGTVMRLCEYIGCKPIEIANKKQTQKSKTRKDYGGEVDYSILISYINKNMLTVSAVCKKAGLSMGVANSITHGKIVRRSTLEKLCSVIDVNPDDVILYNNDTPSEIERHKTEPREAKELKEPKIQKEPKEPESFVNMGYAGAVARVRPARLGSGEHVETSEENLDTAELLGETEIDTSAPPADEQIFEAEQVESGAQKGSSGHDKKFYYSPYGYINLSKDRVKVLKRAAEQDFDTDLQFGL